MKKKKIFFIVAEEYDFRAFRKFPKVLKARRLAKKMNVEDEGDGWSGNLFKVYRIELLADSRRR